MTRTTPEARLIDAGWQPPTDTLRSAIDRREAFRAAIAMLRVRAASSGGSVQRSIDDADADGIVTAYVAVAVARLLDAECQRPDTEFTAISATLETAMRDAIWLTAHAVLLGTEAYAAMDEAAYIRSVAEQALSVSQVVGFNGQPTPTRPGVLSLNLVMVPR